MRFVLHNNSDKLPVVDYLRQLNITRKHTVDIKPYKRTRSLKANALYWLWLTAISVETGNDKDDLHEYFKDKLLPKKEAVFFGESKLMPISTTKLDNTQFSVYLEKIRADMSHAGIVLADPDDSMWESFYEYYKDKL
jgi:hypothetical protein